MASNISAANHDMIKQLAQEQYRNVTGKKNKVGRIAYAPPFKSLSTSDYLVWQDKFVNDEQRRMARQRKGKESCSNGSKRSGKNTLVRGMTVSITRKWAILLRSKGIPHRKLLKLWFPVTKKNFRPMSVKPRKAQESQKGTEMN